MAVARADSKEYGSREGGHMSKTIWKRLTCVNGLAPSKRYGGVYSEKSRDNVLSSETTSWPYLSVKRNRGD